MPSSSAPCQPASQPADKPHQPARRRESGRQSSPSPRPAEDLRGRGGQAQGTAQGSDRAPRPRRVEWRERFECEGRREGRPGDRASSCAVCVIEMLHRQLSGVLEIVLSYPSMPLGSHDHDYPILLPAPAPTAVPSSQQARLQYLWLDRVWYTWPIRLIGLINKALDMLDHWVWCACSVSPRKNTL